MPPVWHPVVSNAGNAADGRPGRRPRLLPETSQTSPAVPGPDAPIPLQSRKRLCACNNRNRAIASVGSQKIGCRHDTVEVVDDDDGVEQVPSQFSGPFPADSILILKSVPGPPDACGTLKHVLKRRIGPALFANTKLPNRLPNERRHGHSAQRGLLIQPSLVFFVQADDGSGHDLR